MTKTMSLITSTSPSIATEPPGRPADDKVLTLWGLSAEELHSRFWWTHRIAVVRPGDPEASPSRADLYLLLPRRTFVWFDPNQLTETLQWRKPGSLSLRINLRRDEDCTERVVRDAEGNFERIERRYRGVTVASCRASLTPRRSVAEAWRQSRNSAIGTTQVRQLVKRRDTASMSVDGVVFDINDVEGYLSELTRRWPDPHDSIWGLADVGAGVFADRTAKIAPTARVLGPLWVGQNQRICAGTVVIGPRVLSDAPATSASDSDGSEKIVDRVRSGQAHRPSRPRNSSPTYALKRPLDVVLGALGLLISLPLWPLIMVAIMIDDFGSPFFVHRRQTRGGGTFPCLKFRSMCRDAERIKPQLHNEVDGPQFFVESDTRLTRVGGFLRRYHLDELPQLVNVLAGDMSLVGPRPSPEAENQFSPAWRDARLSVRPGLTGLWQVERTRAPGRDFMEWIQYDLEYVENISLRLDLTIMAKTVFVLFRGSK